MKTTVTLPSGGVFFREVCPYGTSEAALRTKFVLTNDLQQDCRGDSQSPAAQQNGRTPFSIHIIKLVCKNRLSAFAPDGAGRLRIDPTGSASVYYDF